VSRADVQADIKTVRSMGFSSDGKAILFSGSGNPSRTKAYAEQNGIKPIEITEGGKNLSTYNRYRTVSCQKADHAWREASRKYVNSIEGEVRTFVVGAGSERLFRQVELPTALKNPNITTINGVNRGRILEFQQKKRAELRAKGATAKQADQISCNEAYRAVALAEIKQDLKVAKADKNAELYKDAQKRWETLKDKWKDEQKAKDFVTREARLKEDEQRKAGQQNQDQSKKEKLQNKEQKGVRVELFVGENKREIKVRNAQAAKAEIRDALKNKGIGKVNGIDKARFEEIRGRSEQEALGQGAAPDVAKGVALNKLYGVMARHEQMKDRARVYEKPTKKEADAHMERVNDLNDKIAEIRKRNAALTGQPYNRPEPKREDHRQAFACHGSYALRSRAKLALARAGLESEGKYEEEKERIEKNIAKNKTIDLEPFEQERSQKHGQSEQYDMGHGATLAHLDNAATQYAGHMAQAQRHDDQKQERSQEFGGHGMSME